MIKFQFPFITSDFVIEEAHLHNNHYYADVDEWLYGVELQPLDRHLEIAVSDAIYMFTQEQEMQKRYDFNPDVTPVSVRPDQWLKPDGKILMRSKNKPHLDSYFADITDEEMTHYKAKVRFGIFRLKDGEACLAPLCLDPDEAQKE